MKYFQLSQAAKEHQKIGLSDLISCLLTSIQCIDPFSNSFESRIVKGSAFSFFLIQFREDLKDGTHLIFCSGSSAECSGSCFTLSLRYLLFPFKISRVRESGLMYNVLFIP